MSDGDEIGMNPNTQFRSKAAKIAGIVLCVVLAALGGIGLALGIAGIPQ